MIKKSELLRLLENYFLWSCSNYKLVSPIKITNPFIMDIVKFLYQKCGNKYEFFSIGKEESFYIVRLKDHMIMKWKITRSITNHSVLQKLSKESYKKLLTYAFQSEEDNYE